MVVAWLPFLPRVGVLAATFALYYYLLFFVAQVPCFVGEEFGMPGRRSYHDSRDRRRRRGKSREEQSERARERCRRGDDEEHPRERRSDRPHELLSGMGGTGLADCKGS